MNLDPNLYEKNSGSVLAISLVMLTAITLVALFSMQRSGLQTKIVANVQHVEMLFNTAMNDQEYWFMQLKVADSGDTLLSEPLANFVLDEKNQRNYQAVNLESNADDSDAVQLASNLLHIPPQQGELSLSEGNEVNSRIDYDFELSTKAGLAVRNMAALQKTGLTFPGLNNQKNSIY
ncbi:MAG: hypothetical protein V7765_05225 [Oleispira sp.]